MIECLRDCDAACCKCGVAYMALADTEASLLMQHGTSLTLLTETRDSQGRKEYARNGACKLVRRGWCKINERKPKVCGDFPPGCKRCLIFRAENPHLVRRITTEDLKFQNEYFGWVESD